MKVILFFHNMKNSQKIHSYVDCKLSLIAGKFSQEITSARIAIDYQSPRYRISSQLHCKDGKIFLARNKSFDLFVGIDLLLSKIQRQLRDEKDKKARKSQIRNQSSSGPSDSQIQLPRESFFEEYDIEEFDMMN